MLPVKVALVEDHKLFRKGMVELINGFSGYQVILEANNGKEFIELLKLLKPSKLPELVLLDINMPEMDGYETARWLRQNQSHIKILALSMYDSENIVIRMLKSGAKGYILKDAEPTELLTALQTLNEKGFYFSELVTNTLFHNINKEEDLSKNVLQLKELNSREIEFLKLSATELTYREIADQMCLSVRTVDGYRETLFEKVKVKSRVGLVLFAIKNGIVIP